jgi:DNA polymerase III delta subunit
MAKASSDIVSAEFPVCIVHGSDRFGQLDATDRLRKELTKKHEEFDTALFDGASARAADILDECRSLSLMQRHKLVIVDNADALLRESEDEEGASAPKSSRRTERSAREMFESYAQSPEPSATLLLRAETWRPGKLDKVLEAAGTGVVEKSEPLGGAELLKWVMSRAKAVHRATIDQAGAGLLCDHIGGDRGRLDSELGKLALAAGIRAGEGKPANIDEALVKEMVGYSREETAWALQSGLLQPNPEAALVNLRDSLTVSRNNAVVIGIAYLDLARKLDGVARGLAAGENPMSLKGRLKLWGPSEPVILAMGRKLGPARTAKLLAKAIDADWRQKTGRGEPVHILEALTLEFVRHAG